MYISCFTHTKNPKKEVINYMKKLVSMALALSLCLAMFAGCGGTPSSSSTVSSGPSSSSEDTSTSGFENKELNIAIFEGGYGPEYWEAVSYTHLLHH